MAILDGISNLTGAWSHSRKLLDAYAGAFDAQSGGLVDTLFDQSGSARDFAQTGADRPAAASAGPGARACGDYSGSGDHMLTAATLDAFINVGSGYWIVSFLADTIDASVRHLLSDTAEWTLLGLVTSGGDPVGRADNWDGGQDIVVTAAGQVDTSLPHVIEWRHEGGNLYVRVDGIAWTSVASGNTIGGLSQIFRLGGESPGFFDGKIFEAATFDAVPDDTTKDAIVADFLSWLNPSPIEALTTAIWQEAYVGGVADPRALTTAVWQEAYIGSPPSPALTSAIWMEVWIGPKKRLKQQHVQLIRTPNADDD